MAVFNARAAGGSQSRGAGRAQQHQTLPDPGCIRRLLSDPPGDAWQTCTGMGAIARRRVRWRAATECSVFDHSIAALIGVLMRKSSGRYRPPYSDSRAVNPIPSRPGTRSTFDGCAVRATSPSPVRAWLRVPLAAAPFGTGGSQLAAALGGGHSRARQARCRRCNRDRAPPGRVQGAVRPWQLAAVARSRVRVD